MYLIKTIAIGDKKNIPAVVLCTSAEKKVGEHFVAIRRYALKNGVEPTVISDDAADLAGIDWTKVPVVDVTGTPTATESGVKMVVLAATLAGHPVALLRTKAAALDVREYVFGNGLSILAADDGTYRATMPNSDRMMVSSGNLRDLKMRQDMYYPVPFAEASDDTDSGPSPR